MIGSILYSIQTDRDTTEGVYILNFMKSGLAMRERPVIYNTNYAIGVVKDNVQCVITSDIIDGAIYDVHWGITCEETPAIRRFTLVRRRTPRSELSIGELATQLTTQLKDSAVRAGRPPGLVITVGRRSPFRPGGARRRRRWHPRAGVLGQELMPGAGAIRPGRTLDGGTHCGCAWHRPSGERQQEDCDTVLPDGGLAGGPFDRGGCPIGAQKKKKKTTDRLGQILRCTAGALM
ncbi:hypothetical protein NDU88_005689 [Pleurodeles waltl]|uniref:Uncharacterized protein n=1 Tax=Pleurodeles waltl TaxID=8319 RepID=A0AAV7VP30_PLEWA|nr:hypothetical protein NDU88_005689 [Pleurodeles waltl]